MSLEQDAEICGEELLDAGTRLSNIRCPKCKPRLLKIWPVLIAWSYRLKSFKQKAVWGFGCVGVFGLLYAGTSTPQRVAVANEPAESGRVPYSANSWAGPRGSVVEPRGPVGAAAVQEGGHSMPPALAGPPLKGNHPSLPDLTSAHLTPLELTSSSARGEVSSDEVSPVQVNGYWRKGFWVTRHERSKPGSKMKASE